ncbi:MAG: hypothetical protein JW820_02485 [Spirochaetales bacterium]|nr:hypothetical protein [Spirochaetales bacterium]
MYQAAVVYAPASPEMSAVTDRVVQQLRQERLKVVRKEASQASIPDLTAADLVVLGSAAQGKVPIDRDFAEILRALKGISLAPRAVGVFALGSQETLDAFAKALADCEVALGPGQFLNLPPAGAQTADLGHWLGGLIEQVKRREVPEDAR